MLEKSNRREILEWIICIIIAIILAIAVRHYVFTPSQVREVSMQPTLEDRDRIILDRWSITTGKEIKRGDIITFEAPSVIEESEAKYDIESPVAEYSYKPENIFSKFIYYVLEFNKKSYIKRVIGVEGDFILIEDGKVYLNGELLQENYLEDDVKTERTGEFYHLIVPKGYVFAMGDNREQSLDCRVFGCIPLDKVESKVLLRFYPFHKSKFL